MNSKEYLQLLENNIDNIRHLVAKYHPYYRNIHKHTITAGRAEEFCEQVREEIKKEDKEPKIVEALWNKDCIEINRIANSTWYGMPESMESRYEPGFNVLCDLCSEFPDDIEVDFDEED